MKFIVFFVILYLTIFTKAETDDENNNSNENEDDSVVLFLKMLNRFGFNINSKGKEDKTLAYIAAEDGELEILKVLVEFGAGLSETGGFYEMTPLIVAVKNGHCDVVAFLVTQDINVNEEDTESKTALFRAAEQSEIGCLTMLLKHGADPLIKGTNGMTIMHVAAENGDNVMIQELKKYINLLNAKDNDNKTPLYFAAYKNHMDSVINLVNMGAEIQESVLWGAVSGEDIDIVKYLIDKGGNVNSRDGLYNDTILMKAAIQDNKDITEFLLDKGANIEARNSKGFTALHWATTWDKKSTAISLLNRNADIYAVDNDGKTPLDLAGPQTKQLLLDRTRIHFITKKK